MKKTSIITVLFAFVMTFAAFSQTDQPQQQQTAEQKVNTNGPIATYDNLEYDFGEIVQGTPKTAEFILTNDGKEPLLISNAKASCGCTNLKYSQEPIMPKKSTNISVTYNAAAIGGFIKTITVTTNADPQPIILKIKGTVIAKPVEEEPKP